MKTVLITGASGGFGREFARMLEAEGYRLVLHGRDQARLRLTLDALQQPQMHRCVVAELSDEEGVASLLAEITDEKELIGLVNNAGFGVWGAFAMSESVRQLDVLRTDLIAPVIITHALLPKLLRNRGFIINVSSLAGETPLPMMSTYAAAKAGMTFWSEAIRMELKEELSVVTLAPGPSPTGFRDISGMAIGKGNIFRLSSEEVVRCAITSLKRGGGFVVPRLKHKALWMLQKITPRNLALQIMRNYLK
ncbi:MAG: SDR family NAD(P)-dependent oxidoreductase [Mariprofundaceae bacterium]